MLNKNIATIFEGPCVSSVYAQELMGSVLTKPAVSLFNYLRISDNLFSIQNKPNLYFFKNISAEITFKGTGDPDKCREIVNRIFPVKSCTQSPCMFNNVYRPELRGKFIVSQKKK